MSTVLAQCAYLRTNYFAADDDFYAPIFLPPGRGGIVGNGHVGSEANGVDRIRLYALADQVRTNDVGALLRQFLIELFASARVSVTFDL